MSFLPDNYQAPRSSNYYMKLVEGENRIRIMSKPIFGWEDWKDNKPVRFRMDSKPAKSFDPKKPVKHFWAMVVFNYQEEQIQVLQITQASIRKSLEALCRDKDWGDPYAYDIKVMKTGEGVDTEYAVNPVPHKPVDEYIVKCYSERAIYLDALFDGADPFSSEWGPEHRTQLAKVEEKIEIVGEKAQVVVRVTDKEVSELTDLLSQCSDELTLSVQEFMKKHGFTKYSELSKITYENLMIKAKADIKKQKGGG